MNDNEWYLVNEININGIIFWIEKKIIIIIQAIYKETIESKM